MKKKTLQSGFTLVELLIYMGLFSIMIFLISDVLFAALDVQLSSRSTSSADQDSRYIFNKLSYDIHGADDVTLPMETSSPSSVLRLQRNGQEYTYELNNANLVVRSASQTNQMNSFDTDVSDLSFVRVGGEKGTILVTFTVTSKTADKNGPDSVTNTTAIGQR